ncbi:MAG: alanine racemase [Eubacteriales bacterium]|nr:alanine racemase [Eubacteriales bacterium]
MKEYRRVQARIDLDAFLENVREVKRCAGASRVIAVVKADGYGHGAAALAAEMERLDAVYGYAVATEEEALELIGGGVKKPVMVLGYTFSDAYPDMARLGIQATVFTERMLKEMGEAARTAGNDMTVHIAVDTGMSRIGIRPDDSGLAFVRRAMDTRGIRIEGLFTHFATADEEDKTRTWEQYRKFCEFEERIRCELGLKIPLVHCANSAGILELSDTHLDAVRAGIVLYGMWPSGKELSGVSLKPVLTLESRVAYVKELEAGREISYGGIFTTQRPSRIATIPVGYADGYPRSLSNKASVLIGGRRAPVVGRVCMDQFMVDVTDLPGVKEGDRVVLIGRDQAERITMEELGALSGRFNYELACCLGKRIPRVYCREGKAVAAVDFF